jgi:hypothetical protein
MKMARGVFIAALLAASNSLAIAQAACTEPAIAFRTAAALPSLRQAGSAVFYEMDDVATGDRWLLERDPIHPEGPGRWLRVRTPKAGGEAAATPTRPSLNAQAVDSTAMPVIHTGDEVTVEEHSAVIDARLQAVALGSAAAGSELRVRLRIGGKVVDALALKPGRAVFAAEMWTRR